MTSSSSPTSGFIDPQSLAGKPVDIGLSAISYRADRADNPIETRWLTDGSDGAICGFMWEETRLISRIEIEYDEAVPDMLTGRDLAIERWVGQYSWWVGEWKPEFAQNTHVPTGYPLYEKDGLRFVYEFKEPVQAEKLRFRLYLQPFDTAVTVPAVRVYGPDTFVWRPLNVRIESATGKQSFADAQLEAYNGIVGKVRVAGSGIEAAILIGQEMAKRAEADEAARPEDKDKEIHYDWMRLEDKASHHLLKANRAIVTVETASGKCSFLPADLLTGEPIYCPDYDLFVTLADNPISPSEYLRQLSEKKVQTRRQMTAAHAEQSYERVMKATHPDLVVDYPKPPAEALEGESLMRIEVPEKPLQDAWELGAWHMKRHCPENADGSRAVLCFPYCPLGQESYRNVRVLDLYGMHEVARQGLQHWLNEQGHRAPWGLFSDHDGALILSHDDGRHAIGPGAVLWVMAEHYAMTGDDEWLAGVMPNIKSACAWIARQRQKSAEDLLRGKSSWMAGLQPPSPIGDAMDWRPFYIVNAFFYVGMKCCGEMLRKMDPKAAECILGQAEEYRHAILQAVKTSIAQSPVKKIRSGVYRQVIPMAPYVRGLAADFMRQDFGWTWIDTEFGAMWLARTGVIDVNDPVVDAFLDVTEDTTFTDNRMLRARKEGFDPEYDWFDYAGYHWQHGYNVTPWVYLKKDEIPSFLRAFYNMYACLVEAGDGYTFREHATLHPVHDKPFEEAAFLERLRNMLVMEDGDTLWLAKATPRGWLRDGERIAIANAPTAFGKMEYEIVSELARKRIIAEVTIPSRRAPGKVLLRLRHPEKAEMKSVRVNGGEWKDFDNGAETVALTGLSGVVKVEVGY